MGAKAGSHGIAALAAQQFGLVTRRQLTEAAVARRVVDRLVADGWLHRVHTGVYAVGHPALTVRGRWLAATLAMGPGAILSHRAAGELWAILPRGQPLDVTVPTGRAHRDGIEVHRAWLPESERTTRHGIRTTTLPRTLLDLAAVLDARALSAAFEEAQVQYRLRPTALTPRPGQRGAARLRAVLTGAVDPGQVESVLELRFLALCAAHGLPRPLTQVRFGRWRADFWFSEARVAVEADGARYHATAAKRARDARKDAALTALGATVLRLNWDDVTRQPALVAERVRAALGRSTLAPPC